jgi:heterodisulfide reductase subunit A
MNAQAVGFANFCAPFRLLSFSLGDGKRVSHVNETAYKRCGTCGAACPSGAIAIHHFTNEQILAK